jgi:hypothetical protein
MTTKLKPQGGYLTKTCPPDGQWDAIDETRFSSNDSFIRQGTLPAEVICEVALTRGRARAIRPAGRRVPRDFRPFDFRHSDHLALSIGASASFRLPS